MNVNIVDLTKFLAFKISLCIEQRVSKIAHLIVLEFLKDSTKLRFNVSKIVKKGQFLASEILNIDST